jgi:hypothetical protein
MELMLSINCIGDLPPKRRLPATIHSEPVQVLFQPANPASHRLISQVRVRATIIFVAPKIFGG